MESKDIYKRNKCPNCGSYAVYHRASKEPTYRCIKCGETFDEPDKVGEDDKEPTEQPEETGEMKAEPITEEPEETEKFEIVKDKGIDTPLEELEI